MFLWQGVVKLLTHLLALFLFWELHCSSVAAVTTISPLAPILIAPGGSETITFAVNGEGIITVSARSSDEQLVRSSDLFFSPVTGSSGTRILLIVSQPGLVGDLTITATASSLNSTAERSFPVRIGIVEPLRFHNRAAININGSGPASLYPSSITVPRLPGIARKVLVTLYSFSHTYPPDVELLLESPSGTAVLLLSDAGCAWPVSDLDLKFCSCTDRPRGTNCFEPGVFAASNLGSEPDLFEPPAPTGPFASGMAELLDKSPEGEWRLWVFDDTPSDSGLIKGGWSIEFITEELTVSLQQPDGLSPIISVHGNAGTLVSLEASSDLHSWQAVRAGFLDLDGRMTFTGAVSPQRYFRARRM